MDQQPAWNVGIELKAYWLSKGIKLETSATEQELNSFEARYHVRLPLDMRQYLSIAAGMPDGETEGDLAFSFWPLRRIKPVQEIVHGEVYEPIRNHPDAGLYFCFADYLIDSDIFAIRLFPGQSSPNHVVAVCSDYKMVAPSFADFVRKYLTDPDNLAAA